jgi:ornithine carbamoyltransferase
MLKITYPWTLESLSGDGLRALMNSAGQLGRSAANGAGLPQLLRGKRLALLSDDHASPAAAAFQRAATELGAHVARVRATDPGEAHRYPRDMAALLGQLYDAIECQGLANAEVQQLSRDAGVPVFDGIGHPDHPLRILADVMSQQELQGGCPLEALQLRFDGDPASAAGQAFAHISRLLGLPKADTSGPPPAPRPEVAGLRARHHHHLLQAMLSAAVA